MVMMLLRRSGSVCRLFDDPATVQMTLFPKGFLDRVPWESFNRSFLSTIREKPSHDSEDGDEVTTGKELVTKKIPVARGREILNVRHRMESATRPRRRGVEIMIQWM